VESDWEMSDMRVQEIMTTEVATTTPGALLKEAALELVRRNVSGMPVVEDGRVVGVLSEADILVKEGEEEKHGGFLQWLVDPGDPWIAARFDAVTVADAMSAPARTILPDRTVAEAATMMLDENVNRLPVVDAEGQLLGLVSRADLVRAFVRTDEEIRREIEEDVLRRVMWLDPSEVEVTVEDGIVTLKGEVASEADRDLLPTFARRVPGVVGVSSELTYRL
jgi:CBS domain-containing protein